MGMSSLLEVEGWVEKLMECNLLPETDIISLCKKAKEVFNQARKLSWKPKPDKKYLHQVGATNQEESVHFSLLIEGEQCG